MGALAVISRRLRWINLPGALLLALLQRTPVLRVAATAEEWIAASPLGAVLRSAVTAAASLGALHSLAGATQFAQNPGNPVNGTVGQTISVGFTFVGAPNSPTEFFINSLLPPGLATVPAQQGGVVHSGTPVITGTPTQAGTYNVSVTGSDGTFSGSATITFVIAATAGTAPAITQQPANQTVTTGATATFTVAATGSPAPTFQWRKNGGNVAGATSSALAIASAQAANAGSYDVVVSNSQGSVTSNAVTLTVNAPTVAPSIISQPTSQSANPGATVTFTAAANGTPSPTFQWTKNGANISGATNATLTLVNVQSSDAAAYAIVAANSAGSAASNTVTLTLNVAPGISKQPASQTAGVGATVSFTVSATGTPAPSFQWRKDGVNLSGATTGTLTLNGIQLGDAAGYSVVVTNTAGSVASATATLTVAAGPGFTTQPASQTANAGATVTFAVTATGTPAPAFQWLKNGLSISDATTATLILPNVQPSDTATYAVVATNSAGSTTSNSATLTVNLPPSIVAQPVGQTIALGATVALTVAASGTEPLSYQWFKDGAIIPGATGATLAVNSAQNGDAGNYAVRVFNAAGTVISAAAVLTIAAPSPGRIVNLSILASVSASEPFFTVGTVIGGAGTSGAKPLLIRAAGPSLTPLGVPGTLADPRLDVFSGPVAIASNNDWGGNPTLVAVFAQVGAFPYASAASLDAAAYEGALPAGAYTVQVSGAGGATGAVIAELYDATPPAAFTATTPRLVNVSVLKQLGAGNTLTAGFVIGGATTKTVLIRAIGPGLAAVGLTSGTLADPQLTLFNSSSAVIASNDDWDADPRLIAAMASVNAFSVGNAPTKDAMLLRTLTAGGYTARVSGNNGTSGLVIVEVYEVP